MVGVQPGGNMGPAAGERSQVPGHGKKRPGAPGANEYSAKIFSQKDPRHTREDREP